MKHYAKAIILIVFLVSMSGCVVMGSRDALILNTDSKWSQRQLFGNRTYWWRCEKMSMDIDEIVFKSETTAYGPLLPIIPSGKINDYSNKTLEIRLQILGEVPLSATQRTKFPLQIFMRGKALEPESITLEKISENPRNNDISWVQYQIAYSFEELLSDISSLTIRLPIAFGQCQPDTLVLERQEVSDNALILAPGS